MSRARALLVVALALSPPVVLVACTGTPTLRPAPAGPPAETVVPVPATDPMAASASAASSAIPSVWSSALTPEQRVAFMKQRVVPAMTPVFRCVDPKFGCPTCHGRKFDLPRKRLARLVEIDGKITAFADNPVLATFMAERVVPTMASALGLAPYDPATKQGFGCEGCHEIETKAAKK